MSKFDMLADFVWCDIHDCVHDDQAGGCSEKDWRRLWVGRERIKPSYTEPHEEFLKAQAKNNDSARVATQLFTRWKERDISTALAKNGNGEYMHTTRSLAKMLGRSLKAIDGVRKRYRHHIMVESKKLNQNPVLDKKKPVEQNEQPA